jgi:hypothetical protein
MTAARPGKSAQSVGHLAKAAVAEAKSAGVDLPKTAQGMAASAIAHGADPGSVFAALVAPEVTVETDQTFVDASTPDATDVAAAPTSEPRTNPEAAASYTAAMEIVGNATLDEAAIALALLENAA